MQEFFIELKRRNVFKVGVAYTLVAWVLMQVADILLRTFGVPDWFLQGFYILLGLGFPLALIFAWAFDLTPGGIKTKAQTSKLKAAPAEVGREINIVIAVGFVLSLGFITYDKLIANYDRVNSHAEVGQASIAVLPFLNLSGDPSQEYFSDGISEELLNLLAKIPEMKVAGRTSSFAYKGKNPAFNEIGETLGVAHVLEGSVRKSGQTVRITAQLIRASDGYHMWSETYDRTLDDIFVVQDEIALAITTELRVKILGETPAIIETTKISGSAHSLYLLGLEKLNLGEANPMLEAREYFRQAFEASPGYMDALWGYGLAVVDLFNYGTIDGENGIQELENLLNILAEKEAGEEPLAIYFQANIQYMQGELDNGDEMIMQAFAADPTRPRITVAAANTYLLNGGAQQAADILLKALERDPLSLKLLLSLTSAQAQLGLYDDQYNTLLQMMEIDPDYAGTYTGLALLMFQQGNIANGLDYIIQGTQRDHADPDLPTFIAQFLSTWGFLDQADAYLDIADAMSPDEVFSIAIRAGILVYRGDLKAGGKMAENLILSNRPGRHGSIEMAINFAKYSFMETRQYNRLIDLILVHEPELKNGPNSFSADDKTLGNIFHIIDHSSDLARVYLAQGKTEKATALLEAALDAFGKKFGAGNRNIGLIEHLILLERYEEAMDILRNPGNDYGFLYNRANNVGRWEMAGMEGRKDYNQLAAEFDTRIKAERIKIARLLTKKDKP